MPKKYKYQYKVLFSGNSWTIYRNHTFVARGIDDEGETVIEENSGLSEELIYLLIEDCLN